VMIDSPNLNYENGLGAVGRINARWQKVQFHLQELARTEAKRIPNFLKHQIGIAKHGVRVRVDRREAAQVTGTGPAERDFEYAFHIASRSYSPSRYPGRVLMLQTTERPSGVHWDLGNRWRHLIPQLEVIDIPAGHAEMFHEPHVKILAKEMRERLNAGDA